MQLVVATEKERERQEFGRRLRAVLLELGAPSERGEVQWLYEHLKEARRPLVSYEQCRKYLRGKDIPDQANLRIMARRLRVPLADLQPEIVPAPRDPLYVQMEQLWLRLPDERAKREALRYVKRIVEDEAAASPAHSRPKTEI